MSRIQFTAPTIILVFLSIASHSETIGNSSEPVRVRSQNVEPRLSIRKESSNSVIITGACDEVFEAAQGFAVAGKAHTPKIVQKAEECSTNIAPALPDFYSAFESNTLLGEQLQSANCWGYALAALGVMPIPRQIFSGDLRDFINTPLCEQVQDPKAGDLGLIRKKNPPINHDVHGFVFITPTVRYSKVNSGVGAPVKFEVGTKYGSGDVSISDYAYDMDKHFIEYWRCRSLESWGHAHAHEPAGIAIANLIKARRALLKLSNEGSAKNFPKTLLQELDQSVAKLPQDNPISRLIRSQAAFLKESIKEIELGLPYYCLGRECPASCRPQRNDDHLICPKPRRRR